MTPHEMQGHAYSVVMPHYPYLGPRDAKVLVLTRYPFAGSTYDYPHAVDVLRIFTDRWRTGGGAAVLRPFMQVEEAVGGAVVAGPRFTLSDLELIADAARLIRELTASDRTVRSGRRRVARRAA